MASDKVTVPVAAELLGISENALRKRIQRNTIDWERGEDGRVYVYLSEAMTDYADGLATDHAPASLVESMRDQIDYLRDMLKTRDQELAEMRRLLAGALERIPAIEAPGSLDTASSEPREAPQTGEEGSASTQVSPEEEKRSWWRRFFGA